MAGQRNPGVRWSEALYQATGSGPSGSEKLLVPSPCHMHPDYPHKIFDDKRLHYFLLMEALAMDADLISSPTVNYAHLVRVFYTLYN
jgi:hypothetical protein